MFCTVSCSHPGLMLGAGEQGAKSRSSQVNERHRHNHSNHESAGRELTHDLGKE